MLRAQQKGDAFRKKGMLEKAITAYEMTYSTDPENARNTYNLACAYALTHRVEKAFTYLDRALKKDSTLWVLADNDLRALTSDQRWIAIEKRQLAKQQLKNPDYARLLLRVIMKDQAFDYQLDMAKARYAKTGEVPHWYYPIAAQKKKITTENFKELKKLLKKYGWPRYDQVGKLAADAPLLVINHHPEDSVRVAYLPMVKKACESEQGSCLEYAKIYDRILVNQGKEQWYGMQFRYGSNRQLEPFPVADPSGVDARRKAIGLEPLGVYLKRKINFKWTIPQE